MSGEYIETKTLTVEVQENGWIRDQTGWIIGRLADNEHSNFEDLIDEAKK